MRTATRYWLGTAAIVVFAVVFIVPFLFIVLTAMKDQQEAGQLEFTWPSQIALLDNLRVTKHGVGIEGATVAVTDLIRDYMKEK